MTDIEQNFLDFARFRGAEAFSWSLFDGFERMRALTYSVSTPMIFRMLERHGFRHFECVFGYEAGLGRFADVIAFQQFLVTQLREAALKLKDERQRKILERIHAGDDDGAWDHYTREYDAVKRTASNRIDLPVDLKEADIAFTDTPVLQEEGVTVFQPPPAEELTIPQVMHKVEELTVPVDSVVTPQVKREKGRFVLTPAIKAEIKRLRWVKGGQEEENSRPVRLSIDRGSRHISLSGDTVPLEVDREGLAQSARAIVEYFDNYERGFIGDVRRLQRGYFTFMSWLYASPFGRSPARGSRWSGARPPAAASPGPASSTWSRPWWRWTAGGCGGAGRC